MEIKSKIRNNGIALTGVILFMSLMLSVPASAYELEKIQVICNDDGTFSTKNVYLDNPYPRSSENVCFEISADDWADIESDPDFPSKARADKGHKKLFIDPSVIVKIKTPALSLPRDARVGLDSSLRQDLFGQLEIKPGFVEARVEFESKFNSAPIVTLTSVGLPNFFYGVSDVTTSGFSVKISGSQQDLVIFNWHASAKDANSPGSSEKSVPKSEVPIKEPALQVPESGGSTNLSSEEALLTITGQATGELSRSGSESSLRGLLGKLLGFFK